MKTTGIFILAALFSLSAWAQKSKVKQDKEAIKAMCGCYSITFDYAETFAKDSNYKLHDPYHAEAAAEWIFVDEETDDHIVIQHILVVNDTQIVKHWRQDWVYENTGLYEFQKNMHWNYVELPAEKVQGQWTQKVYQVDDGPRYEGSATWVHVDGEHYWESTTDAPLPRREFTKRDDYNVIQRTNRHVITGYGWLHEQDNVKVIRKDGEDHLLVEEKGLNKYTETGKSNCKPAREWWSENKGYWRLVRKQWNKVYDRHQDIILTKKVNDQFLWQALFELGKESQELAAEKPGAVEEKIGAVIGRYLADEQQTGSATY